MNFLQRISLKNFRSFRDKTSFSFGQLTYLIGVNNAGKTNVLHGMKGFFDDTYFRDGSFLNRAAFVRKQAGYNRAELTVDFDLDQVTTKSRKASLLKNYGEILSLRKIVTFLPDSLTVLIEWEANEKKLEKLPDDIQWLLNSVKVTYIHPQEGKQLLENVQRRLRQRLLANWGRNAALTHAINDLEEGWRNMRESAGKYLSQALTESLQSFWLESSVVIDLPRNFKEVIEISDISFRGFKGAPEISLTSQGTGAQSTVLYLAHYILDSDKTLNRGEYHPIWLMEEPESFLHSDLLVRLAKQIHSEDWQKNIQMFVSTHSPILLASSRASQSKVIWNILEDQGSSEIYVLPNINNEIVSKIGKLMGDPNFLAYFNVAHGNEMIFIEDDKEDIISSFARSGIPVTKGLGGISEIGTYLDVLSATPEFLKSLTYFIIDSDRGLKSIARHLDSARVIKETGGFKKYSLAFIDNAFIISLPEGTAVEELFGEYDNHLQESISKIWNDDFSVKDSIPTSLSRVTSKARSRIVTSRREAIDLIKNEQDIKELFWSKVKNDKYKFNKIKSQAIKTLMTL